MGHANQSDLYFFMQLLQEQIQVSAQQIRLYSFVKWEALFTYAQTDLQPLQSSLLKNFPPYMELMQLLQSFNSAVRLFKQEGQVPEQAVLRHYLCQQISKLLRLAVKAPTKLHQENMVFLIHSKLKIFFPNQSSLKTHSSVQRNQPQSKASSKPKPAVQSQKSQNYNSFKGGHRPLTGVTRHSSTYSRARAVSSTRPQTGLTRQSKKQQDQNQLTQLNITNIEAESQMYQQYRAADFFCQQKKQFSEGCRTSHREMEIPSQRIQQYQRKTLNKFIVPVVQVKQKIIPSKSQIQPPIQPYESIQPVQIQPIKIEAFNMDPLLQLEGNNQGEPLLQQQLGDQQQGQIQQQIQQKNRLAPKTKPFLTDLPSETDNAMMPLRTYIHQKESQVQNQLDKQLIVIKKQNAKFRSRVQSQMGRKVQSINIKEDSRREECAQKQICQNKMKQVLHQNLNLIKLDQLDLIPVQNKQKSLTKYSCSKAKPFSTIIKQANLTFNKQQEDQTFQVKSKAAKNKSYFALDIVQKGISRPQYDPKEVYKESGITGMFLMSNPFFPKKKKKSKKKSKK